MKLSEWLATDPTNHSDYVLVFDDTSRAALAEAQANLPNDRQNRVEPRALINNQWLLSADVLTEVGVGGLYHSGFQTLSPSVLANVEVLPNSEGISLLPIDEDNTDANN